MDYLTICHQACRDGGWSALIPQMPTLASLTGRPAKIAGWVSDAWVDIQNERQDWLFLQKSFTQALTIGQRTYTKANLSLPRLAAFRSDYTGFRTMTLYDPAIGQKDEGELIFIPFERWLDMYDRRTHDPNRPRDWSVSPQRELLVGPTPDKAYVLRGRYRATPQVLEDDSDEPECPEEFHGLIPVEAIRIGLRAGEALQLLPEAGNQYTRRRSALVIDQTPPASM